MTGFESDIRSQGQLLAALLTVDRQDALLARAAALADPGRPIVFTGMGSSLAAARSAAARVAAGGLWSTVGEAGELLHYGLEALPKGSLVVLVSQSGRSAETTALGERLLAAGGRRIIAIVNDPASPIARMADVVVPIRAGEEATVSTKTFVATLVLLHGLADALIGAGGDTVESALRDGLVERVGAVLADAAIAGPAASAFAGVQALVLVGRGPGFTAADYGALILKEACAIPAEAMFAGSFRHGPIEITGPSTGVIVVAPPGRTSSLCIRLAEDTARLGSPTWLLTGPGDGSNGGITGAGSNGLMVSSLPGVAERFAPFLYCLPLQHLAVRLAVLRHREPGIVERSGKVTVSE